MAQFKRFNTSENDNYDSSASYPEGTLTWDPSNGLRIHDGSTSGGNTVGGGTVYWGDIENKPYGTTAVHDLQGGSNSAFNGYFLKQTSTGVSEWSALPTTYDTLTIDTKIIGGIDGAAGTQITGIEATLGSGVPWRYAFIGGNDAFGNLFNRGNALIGWKMYPASDPSAFVTITEFLNNDLGAPSLGFDGSLGQGPWVAESSDYSAGANGPLTLSADTKNWVLGTDGVLTLPEGGDIQNSSGNSLFPNQLLNTYNNAEFGFLYIGASSGDEGGEMRLALPQTNTTLSGTGVTIDIYRNKLRIFEQGGNARGVYIDLSSAADSVGTNLLAGGGSGTTLPLDAAGVLKNDGTGTLSWSSLDIQDLTDNGNLLNFTQQQADWTENNAASPAYIQNKPMLVTSYNELTDKPDLFNGDYLSLTGTPSLANVATTGMYGDLTGTPTSLSDFTNDPGFISASDLAVSSGGSGSLSYSNGLFTYEGPTVPTDISELTDNTNLLSSGGGTTLPADASGYLNNNGSGTLTWVAGNPTGSGMLPYNGVTVLSNTVTADWTEYTLSGTMDAFYDWNNSFTTITLSSQTAYGKEITANTKNLWINDSKINSNDYLVIEFPATPSVGDVFSVPVVNILATVNAGSFVVGETYTIVNVGTTNWTSIGAQYSGTGQSFVATGVGSGTGTATTSAGAKKLIFKPASGHRAHTMAQGNLGPIAFGQGGTYDFMYIDLSGLNAGNPITWVYAGLISGVPSWYQFYF